MGEDEDPDYSPHPQEDEENSSAEESNSEEEDEIEEELEPVVRKRTVDFQDEILTNRKKINDYCMTAYEMIEENLDTAERIENQDVMEDMEEKLAETEESSMDDSEDEDMKEQTDIQTENNDEEKTDNIDLMNECD